MLVMEGRSSCLPARHGEDETFCLRNKRGGCGSRIEKYNSYKDTVRLFGGVYSTTIIPAKTGRTLCPSPRRELDVFSTVDKQIL